jgi:uncharacterized Fe-S cluster protein YjdI
MKKGDSRVNNLKPAVYRGTDFEVTYDKDVCTHAAVCVKTLPNVFDPKKKPWVNTDGATKQEIANMIKTCPSGALQFIDKTNG